MGRLHAGLVLVAVAACKPNVDAHPAPPDLYSDAQVAALKAALDARLATPVPCARPVLHGETAPGAPTTDQRALLAATDACATSRATWTPQMVRALITSNAPEIATFDTDCGAALATAVQRAVAHGEGCSPYQVGAPAPPEQASQLPIALLVGVHARTLAAKDPAAALWLVLDTVRLFRDLRRGPTGTSAATLATEATHIALADATELVARVPAAQLAPLIAAVDQMIADEPSLQATYVADAAQRALEEQQRPTPIKPLTLRSTRGLMLEAAAMMESAVAAACPADATHVACATGLATAAARADRDAEDAGQTEVKLTPVTNQLAARPTDPALREQVRRGILAILHSDTLSSYANRVARDAIPLASLAALRLALEVRRVTDARADASGFACPTTEALAAPPWSQLAAPARLGEPLVLTRDEQALTIAAPDWISAAAKAPTFVLACR